MNKCLICMEESGYMTVGNCGHPFTCLECAYKYRVISKSKRCTYCNVDLDKIIVYSQKHSVPDVNTAIDLIEFKCGIFFTNQETRVECLKLENKQCFIGSCKAYFETLQQFYTHLKTAHKRFMCNLCVENRALLLREQKVYREEEYSKHMYSGDYDEENNLMFVHPYCDYCKVSFFNDDIFLDHLRKAHMVCNLCDQNLFKYTFHKDFHALTLHYNSSHYACQHPDCQGVAAFKKKYELESHILKEHDKSKQKKSNIGDLIFENESKKEESSKNNEHQGLDFTNSVR